MVNSNEKIVNNIMETKKQYTLPAIEIILLDNEISLALESSPPLGPGESASLAPEFAIDQPFKNKLI